MCNHVISHGLLAGAHQTASSTIYFKAQSRITLLETIQAPHICQGICTDNIYPFFSLPTSQVCGYGCDTRPNIRSSYAESNKDNISVQGRCAKCMHSCRR